MKIPEPLFKLINLFVVMLLRSPVHGFWSKNLLVISFTGRRSGRQFRTPVRYIRGNGGIQCFTSKSGQWWRNVAASRQATLLVEGVEATYVAEVVVDEPDRIRIALLDCLAQFPQDAVYHDIRIAANGLPEPSDLERELPQVVLLELHRTQA